MMKRMKGKYGMECSQIMASVIMPVYNSEKYLEEAIKSVLNQSYGNLELILVDDGSSDGSGRICDRYSELDPRVRTVHQKNGGISNARNTGLSLAEGKYVAFIDNDDEMLPDCLEKTIEFAEGEQLDMVRFIRRHVLIRGTHIKSEQIKISNKEVIRIEAGVTCDDYLRIVKCGYTAWSGIYNRDLINKNKISFDESIRYGYEDCIFVLTCITKCGSVGILPECLYVWKQRKEHSTTLKSSKEILQNRVDGILKCFELDRQLWDAISADEADRSLREHDIFSWIVLEILRYGYSYNEKISLVKQYKKQIEYKRMNLRAFLRVDGLRKKVKYLCLDFNLIRIFEFFSFAL